MPYLRRTLLVALYAVVSGVMPFSARSATFLIDSGQSQFMGAGLIVWQGEVVAQQFSLSSAAEITSIAPFLSRLGSGPPPTVTFEVTDRIGPGTAAVDVLATYSVVVSNPIQSAGFLPVSTSLRLGPGSYFLVLSSDASLDDGATWANGAPIDIGPDFNAPFGNANAAFPPASVFSADLHFNPGLRVGGVLLPEPGTQTLIGVGMLLALALGFPRGRTTRSRRRSRTTRAGC